MNHTPHHTTTPDPDMPPYRPEMLPLNQGWNTTWLVTIESERTPDDPWTGWLDVHADARTRRVDINSAIELSPVEARNLAVALLCAAEHAEHFAGLVLGVLDNQERFVHLDLHGEPIEAHQSVHEWFRRAQRRLHHEASTADQQAGER